MQGINIQLRAASFSDSLRVISNQQILNEIFVRDVRI